MHRALSRGRPAPRCAMSTACSVSIYLSFSQSLRTSCGHSSGNLRATRDTDLVATEATSRYATSTSTCYIFTTLSLEHVCTLLMLLYIKHRRGVGLRGVRWSRLNGYIWSSLFEIEVSSGASNCVPTAMSDAHRRQQEGCVYRYNMDSARQLMDGKTKPVGSLGILEDWAIR